MTKRQRVMVSNNNSLTKEYSGHWKDCLELIQALKGLQSAEEQSKGNAALIRSINHRRALIGLLSAIETMNDLEQRCFKFERTILGRLRQRHNHLGWSDMALDAALKGINMEVSDVQDRLRRPEAALEQIVLQG
ncbi:uncharacterized protein CTRU02_215804 [Colletotrichum truncatum]|uniref:Uncharacterized protein n=1 Tax=Colletotrichum truncatum TaxID=5467 RepID=A0ACC3YBR1_COLTU